MAHDLRGPRLLDVELVGVGVRGGGGWSGSERREARHDVGEDGKGSRVGIHGEREREIDFGVWEFVMSWDKLESIQCSVENIVLRILFGLVTIRNGTVTSDFIAALK